MYEVTGEEGCRRVLGAGQPTAHARDVPYLAHVAIVDSLVVPGSQARHVPVRDVREEKVPARVEKDRKT